MKQPKEYMISQLFKMKWEELTSKEMVSIIELSGSMLLYENGSKEYGLHLIEILRVLRKDKSAVSKMTIEQDLDCFNNIDFFQRNEDGSFKNPWHFFPIGNFKVGVVDFIQPQMSGSLPMYNRTFDQLVYADSSFSAFCLLNYQAGEEKDRFKRAQIEGDMNEALNNLIAILYHPQFNFSIDQMEVNSHLVRLKLTTSERALILHTYANVRKFITNRCPHLFPGLPEPENDLQLPQPPQLTGPMWLKLRYDLAETEVFKGFNTARNALIYDALDFLEQKAYEATLRKENDKG